MWSAGSCWGLCSSFIYPYWYPMLKLKKKCDMFTCYYQAMICNKQLWFLKILTSWRYVGIDFRSENSGQKCKVVSVSCEPDTFLVWIAACPCQCSKMECFVIVPCSKEKQVLFILRGKWLFQTLQILKKNKID